MFDPAPLLSEAAERRIRVLIASLLLFSSGCGDSTGPLLLPTDLCAGQPDEAVVSFEDPNLEAAIRNALSIGVHDDITCGLASSLPSLHANFSGIAQLTGIQNFTRTTELLLAGNFIRDLGPLSGLTGLDTLDLRQNDIGDISALSGLTSLTALSLTSNSIEDISAVSGLTGLRILNLDGNEITDIAAVSRLASLEGLVLFSNTITDIGALGEITGLFVLDLGQNPVADISALSSHASLTTLGLDNTFVTDISVLKDLSFLSIIVLSGNPNLSNIQPLLDNPEFGVDDTVDLTDTGVSCTDIADLKAKLVNVIADC